MLKKCHCVVPSVGPWYMINDVKSWVRTKSKDKLLTYLGYVKRGKLSMARKDPKNISNIHKVSPRTKNVFNARSTNIL